MRAGIFVFVIAFLAVLQGCQQERRIRLATTTSVDNSGLLEALLEDYEERTGIDVDALAVGSGRAMELVRRGDADLMITHDPEGEREFLNDHRPVLYRKLMCSDFIIVGPAGDPARLRGAASVVSALQTIVSSDSMFVSRGDRSGTHAREEHLRDRVPGRPEGNRLLESGQGMAATLRIASEREAYTLTDRPTYLQLLHSLDLEITYEGPDPELLNCYAVTVPSGPRQNDAVMLAEWLTRAEGRELIAAFEIGGERVFRLWPDDQPDDHPESVPR